MFKSLRARIKQKHRTIAFPEAERRLPERFRGLPQIEASKCQSQCKICEETCPTEAIDFNGSVQIDLGRCIFCTACSAACPQSAFHFTQGYQLACRSRQGLILRQNQIDRGPLLEARLCQLFGRSLNFRQVSAGGCNACEADINVLSTIVFDIGRFGIQIVASPRHADGLLITGPVTENMRIALEKTYEAVPDPKIVVAVGACAVSGGLFRTHPQQHGGADAIVPVDVYVPGCPPHPLTILEGILHFLDKSPL
jgi:Ni,Fe-hydrogenase III small subunit/Pyruvate/2-oxoacid:ferredoxin oxidoreductase delta subunit